MQQPKMIVLGLIAMGRRYGFEMEAFIEQTNMRQWAQIGMSTIYKSLGDLEKEQAIVAKKEHGGKGPPRKSYTLTLYGRKQLRALVTLSMKSDMPVYSDRIAGLVFAPLIGGKHAASAITNSQASLRKVDCQLREDLDATKNDAIAQAVIQFYLDVSAAEQTAMRKVIAALKD